MIVRVKKTVDDAIIPTYGSAEAAGMDLYATQSYALDPGKRAMIGTGISVAIPIGYYGRVSPRSGLAWQNGIDVLAGVIDSDYRGEIKVILLNTGLVTHFISKGDRIAQMIIAPVTQGNWNVVADLDETARGAGGFGSTGTGSKAA